MKKYYLINRSNEYFGTITADKPPPAPYILTRPPQSIIDGLKSPIAPSDVAEWGGASWVVITRPMMSAYRHKDSYRTLIAPDEMIDMFTGSEWREMRGTTDPDAMHFVDQIRSRSKIINLAHPKVTVGLTALVQASDITFNKQRALDILKGVKL